MHICLPQNCTCARSRCTATDQQLSLALLSSYIMSKDFTAQKEPSMSAKDGEPTSTSESLTPIARLENEPLPEVGVGGPTQHVPGTITTNLERRGACLCSQY